MKGNPDVDSALAQEAPPDLPPPEEILTLQEDDADRAPGDALFGVLLYIHLLCNVSSSAFLSNIHQLKTVDGCYFC